MWAYAANNPIKYTDPDGRDVLLSFFRGFIDAGIDDFNSVKDFASDIPGSLSNFYNEFINVTNAIFTDPTGFGLALFEAASSAVGDFIEGSADEKAYAIGRVAESFVVAYLTGKATGKIIDIFKGPGKGLHLKNLPMETHHFATNKNKQFTSKMSQIAKKYGLDLDGNWNKRKMPHRGRHPNKYHEFVLNQMEKADVKAKGSQKKFLKYYEKYVINPVSKNPEMLRKSFWEGTN